MDCERKYDWHPRDAVVAERIADWYRSTALLRALRQLPFFQTTLTITDLMP